MTSVAEARATMLAAVRAPTFETVALAQAGGRVLGEAVIASRAQPPFAASAMDGYALRAADTPGQVRVVGESAAGHAYPRALAAGECVRISTGAPLPDGADTILIQEDSERDGDVLNVGALQSGRHVRAAGCDFAADARLLEAGRVLDPIALALAAAAGAASLSVAQRPKVTVMTCGDEIAPPGTAPRADQIFESCSIAIAALAARWGGLVQQAAPLPDDAGQIEEGAARALATSDLVVLIGGASVGPHDHGKPAFERCGADILVPKIDMRPGKPTWFAVAPDALVLGLPGNPASAIVAAMLFLRPLLHAMQGAQPYEAPRHARLARALPQNGPRETYLRAHVVGDGAGALMIEAFADQDSSLLSVFAQSNALLVRPARAPGASADTIVEFIPL